MREKTHNMVLAALFSAIIAVFSQLAIPSLTGMPMTMQTFAVSLTGFVLGSFYGAVSVGVYILVGAVGIPVFTALQGGLGALFGTSGGFIFGFLPLAALCGTKKPVLAFVGLFICHLFGILWFSVYTGNIKTAFLSASAPYIVKDVISVLAAMLISKKILGIVKKFK